MAKKVLINGIYMTLSLPKPLFMAIMFKLMAIKIVLNEVERNTAIEFSLQFSDHLNKNQGQSTNIQIYVSDCFCRCTANLTYRLILDFSLSSLSQMIQVFLYFIYTYTFVILQKILPHNNV